MDRVAEKLRIKARAAQKKRERWMRILFAVTAVCFLIIKFFVVDCVRVKGESMVPTYLDGQFTVVAKCAYWFREPLNGDVVIIKHGEENYIKRITACPGERPEDSASGETLPQDYYYVEGDNRPVSIDSRSFGPVPRAVILGKVIF